MNVKPSKTMIMTLLIISITTASTMVEGESVTYLPPPHKQIESGASVEDVVCNSGLTLMLKLSSGSSTCVKPSTAMTLEERGWGIILKESSMMEEQRMRMIEKQEQLMKEQQEKIMEEKTPKEEIVAESIYEPKINPRNFVPQINNKFFTLIIGTTLVYESQLGDGVERTEFSVTDEGRKVMGVDTTVVWDRVWLNDQLIEDTKDWFAQDLEGNVWYFGEDSKEFEGGKLVGTKGSWEAGIDEAKPGIIMKAVPQLGDSYRQEFYPGKAEDMVEITSLNETVSVPYGKFSGCLKTREWSPLEAGVTEFKYYCSGIGGVVLETNPEDDEMVELIDVKGPVAETTKETLLDITVEEAKEIALNAVPGVVTDVEKDMMMGRTVYVIEVAAKTGIETDVFIDIKTGKILAIEE